MSTLPSILGAAGDAALRALLTEPALIAFDFDGTLAPIVEHPPQARLHPAVDASLRDLAALAPLAIVSGRALDDLRERAPIGALRLIGNHGNDGLHVDPLVMAQAHAVCRRWRQALERAISARLGADTGVQIEDKATTLSVHYRHAADPPGAHAILREIIADLQPAPRVIGGKLVINLLPPGAQTKFEALQQLADQLLTQQVVFVGDDDTDEIVFERAPHTWLTVRVEPEERSAARFALATQDDVAQLIDRMIALLTRPHAGAGLRSS